MPNAVYDDEKNANQTASSAAQKHTDNIFKALTSAEHLARTGKSGNSLADTDGGAFDNNVEGQGPRPINPEYATNPDGGSPGKTRGKSRFSRLTNRFLKLAIEVQVGIAGLALVAILAIFLFFGSASLQAVHLAQMLLLDQSSSVQYSELRSHNMYRYVKSGGNLGETRVSWLGSKMFSSSVSQLRDIGVTFDTNESLGVLKGTIIDTDKFPVTKDTPKDEVARKLASHFKEIGLTEGDISIHGNQAVINRDLSLSDRKTLIRGTVSELDNGKIVNALLIRQIKKFYSIPTIFHPFRIVDQKITQKIDTHEQLIKEEKARKTGKTYESPKRAQAYADFKNKTSGIRAGLDGALLIVGGVCIARSAADDAITYNREAVVIPEALAAADAIAVGSQQQSNMDFTGQQLNIYNQASTDTNGKSYWNAKALQAKSNPTAATGEDIPDAYSQAFNEISGGANTLKNAGGDAGAVACSKPGQVAQITLGGILVALSLPTSSGSALVYGALKTAGGAAAGIASMAVLHQFITDSLKDDPIPDNVSAPVKGNLIAYGSRELANINARANGGVELSSQESTIIDTQVAASERRDFKSKTLASRLFDVHDYRSLASRAIDSSGTPQQSARNIASGLTHLGSIFSTMFNTFIPSVHAAPKPYNYGFNHYGIPARILNNPAYADPYKNSDIVAGVLDSEQGKTYIDRVMKCFGDTVSADSHGKWGVTPSQDVNPQSSEYQDAHCNASDDSNWDRMILFVNDSKDMDAMACYKGDSESCTRIGVDTSTNICSINNSATTGVTNMPSWVKMPIVNAQAGGPVNGNIRMAVVNIKDHENVPPSLKIITGNSPDFIGLNEVGDASLQMIRDSAPGYEVYRDGQADNQDGGGIRSLDNAIMWRKDTWTFIDGGRIQTADDDHTFYSGKPVTWDRYAAWAVFKRNSDGATVPVIITHAMTNPAKYPKQHDTNSMTRIQQYKLSMDILLQLASDLSQYGPVLIGGDMNAHSDQGDWSAVPQMKAANYNYASDGDVIYAFNPQGTKLVSQQVVKVPLNGDHLNNSLLAVIDMNGAGPGAVSGIPAATGSTSGCPSTAPNDSTILAPGEVPMQDDYASECAQFTSCSHQCVDFVKFRLKKYVDKGKFDDFTSTWAGGGPTNDMGGQAAATSSYNLGRLYGYKVDHTPAVNSVVSWPPGGVAGSHANDTYGHVAMVSKVNTNPDGSLNSIVVEEYNATIPALTYDARKISAPIAQQLTYAHTEVDFK